MFYLPAYIITPSSHPVKWPPQCPSPIHPHPPPTSPSITPSSFPELGVFMFCPPFWYFPLISSPFPYIPFHYHLYSPNEWEHTMFVLLQLTYITQDNTSSSIHVEANGGYLSFLMAEQGPPVLSLHLLSLLRYECYCFIFFNFFIYLW